MRKHLFFPGLSALVLLASFGGCSTNGDPHSHGLFWSEKAAKERQAERQKNLESLKSDTGRVSRQNRELESSVGRPKTTPE